MTTAAPRYHFAALASAMHVTPRDAAAVLGLRRVPRCGLDVWTADELATRAGLHPSSVWASWWDDALADTEPATHQEAAVAEQLVLPFAA